MGNEVGQLQQVGQSSENYTRSQTVQSNNTQIPAISDPVFQPKESSPTVIQSAKKSAVSHLKRKNRKQNQFILTFPVTFQIEAGTKYNVSGFTPDADAQDWIVEEVEIRMSGKHGSETRVTMCPDMSRITDSSTNADAPNVQQADQQQPDSPQLYREGDRTFLDNSSAVALKDQGL
jgi:hypothetical protein